MKRPGIPGVWANPGGDLQVAPFGQLVNFEFQNTDHVCSICLGPDGYPWIAWLEGMTYVGGGANRQYGIYVRRWDGSAWQDVPGPANGAVSDVSVDASAEGQSILHPASGEVSNFSGDPQICTDGTYVYVQHGNGTGGGAHLLVWQCDPGSAYAWTALTALPPAVNTGLKITASAQDVGHPYAAIRTSTSPLQTTVYRYNAGAWSAVGGGAISRASPDSTSLAVVRVWLDDDGLPHVLHGPSASGTVIGSDTAGVMYSYTGSAWVQKDCVMTGIGAPSKASFTAGYMRAGPLYNHAGDAGRCQVVFRTPSYDTDTPESRGSGYLGYLVEYDFRTRTWEAFRGDWLKGFLWTYRQWRVCAIPIGSLLNQNPVQLSTRYISLAEPLDDDGGGAMRALAWHNNDSDFGNALYSYDEMCPVGWEIVDWLARSTGQSVSSFDQDTVIRDIDTDTDYGNGGLQDFSGILRDGDDVWLVGRWWNGQEAYCWHTQCETYAGFAADRVSESGGEPVLPSSTYNAVQTNVAWNKDTDGATAGRLLASVSSVLGSRLAGVTTTCKVRAMVKGTGNADFIVLQGTTEVGRVRVDSSVDGDTVWVEKVVNASYSTASSGVITVYGGINGGSSYAVVDWVEFRPTDTTLETKTETRVYQGTITQDVLACCATFLSLAHLRSRDRYGGVTTVRSGTITA